MSISTYSAFIYGHTITDANQFFIINEGGGEVQVALTIGAYTLGGFVLELSTQLNNVGSQEYTLFLDRTTRRITITAPSAFSILVSSGSVVGQDCFELAGFTGSDRTGSNSYEGNIGSGTYFEPQNILQDYIDFEDNVKTVQANVNESASGSVEVVSYGQVKFMECNIKPQINQTGQVWIKDDANGVDNLRAFLLYAITKAPMEFVPNVDNPSFNVREILLESNRANRNGVDYKITQFRRLFKWFQSGQLVFREI